MFMFYQFETWVMSCIRYFLFYPLIYNGHSSEGRVQKLRLGLKIPENNRNTFHSNCDAKECQIVLLELFFVFM